MKKIICFGLFFALAFLANAQIEWRTSEKQAAVAVFVELPAQVDSVIIATETEISRGTKTVRRWRCVGSEHDGMTFEGLAVFHVEGNKVKPIAYTTIREIFFGSSIRFSPWYKSLETID